MSKSARSPTVPIGRQGSPCFPGGHLMSSANRTSGPIEIALVAGENVAAGEAFGGLPMMCGSVVIIWRCTLEEARRHERSGRFDCIVYCEADEHAALRLRYTAFRRSSLWKGLDGGII